jgi:hypothetical protein
MTTPISCVGDKLIVGQITYPIQDSTSALFGYGSINGPLVVGANYGGPPTANAMFGPGFTGLPALESVGITNIYGKMNVFSINDYFGITNIFGSTFGSGLRSTIGVDIKNALNLGNGPTVFNNPLRVNSSMSADLINVGTLTAIKGIFTFSISAPGKQFNVPHPSKPGYRLVHGCLEGPEYGVYYRGRLQDQNQIILPDYWEKLINPETITINLTSNRYHQELYVKSIEWGKVINIVNNSGGSIDCYYTVYAERIDIDKLEVEQKVEDNGD